MRSFDTRDVGNGVDCDPPGFERSSGKDDVPFSGDDSAEVCCGFSLLAPAPSREPKSGKEASDIIIGNHDDEKFRNEKARSIISFMCFAACTVNGCCVKPGLGEM